MGCHSVCPCAVTCCSTDLGEGEIHGEQGGSAAVHRRSLPVRSDAFEPQCRVPRRFRDPELARAQGDVGPPGFALDLRVRDWRRFLELPMDHMLAVAPDTARGRYRVGVWMTPEMTGAQAARLVALHARYHVGALGFHEEQARRVPEAPRFALRVSCLAVVNLSPDPLTQVPASFLARQSWLERRAPPRRCLHRALLPCPVPSSACATVQAYI